MFLPLSGLSVVIHLVIIVTGVFFNFVRGRGARSAYQTYHKDGGIFKSKLANRLISYTIVIVVSAYMVALAVVAITTALRLGYDEPQMQFYLYLAHQVVIHFDLVLLCAIAFLSYYAVQVSHPSRVLPLPVLVSRGVNRMVDVAYELVIFISMKAINLYGLLANPFVRFTPTRGALGSTNTISEENEFALGTSLTLRLSIVVIIVAALLGLPTWASAQIVEPGFESETVVNDLSLATAFAFTPDGRILIAEKGGAIKVVKNGVLLPEPLVTLTDVNTFGDRGLLGLAVDPNFEQNGYIYVSYSYENTPGLNIAGPKTGRIVRLTVVGDTASESSKFVLVGRVGGDAGAPSCENYATTADCIASDSNSHSVGGLRFGPDGKLYATLGDGADFVAVDPRALRAQSLDSLAGKMLRINTDGTAPADNPFYNGSSTANRSKVYALGLRNAFRFNFNPVNGQLYIGDVGWGNWEEINRGVAGANYGWPCREGNGATSYGCTPSSAATNPLYTYAHNSAGAGSITAGSFGANDAYPDAYDTSLFMGDYAQMWMKRLVLNAAGTSVVSVQDFNTDVFPVDIVTGPDGNVYYIDIVTGSLNRLTHTNGNRRPVVNITANPTSGLTPLNVNFSSAGTSDPDGNPLTYEWNFGDGATSTLVNPSHVYTVNGEYIVSLTVTDSLGSAMTESTDILAGNQKPTATITNPASGSLYNVGENITVTGAGTDPENGNLAASRLSWQVILHHNTHTHTIYQANATSSITFPADDHDAADVYLEIVLTATDSAGLTDTESINMYLNNGIGAGNLISNPSLETEGTVAGSPLNWFQSWYGVMNPVFTYPVTGFAGERAARIQVTGYNNGAAKWLFAPVFVTAGEQYTFSNRYTATTPTEILVQFGRSDGTYTYQFLEVVPAVATPTRTEYTFTIPAGVESATVFHEITSNGTLTVDDFTFTLAGSDVEPPTGSITSPAASSTVSGNISVGMNATDNEGIASVKLVVDGTESGVPDSEAPYAVNLDTTALTNGPHTIFGRMLDTTGNIGETAPITIIVNNGGGTTTPPTNTNLVPNGNFETAGTGGNPASWNRGGWGTNTRTFTYPVTGFSGNGASITVTGYTNGDAKWYFNPVTVTPGTTYTIADRYNSNVSSQVVAQLTGAGGALSYVALDTLPSTGSTWQTYIRAYAPPAGTTQLTLFHLIASNGTLTIDNVEVIDPNGSTTTDSVPPVVAITAPAANATVTGTTTITASSSDNVGVAGVTLLIDGNVVGAEDTTAPYSFAWNSASVSNGAHTIAARSRDAAGNVTTSASRAITVSNSTSTSDTTLPTATVTAPAAGATVSGTTTVTATAADNIAVAGVTLLIDGNAVGAEDTTAPYSFAWNSASVSNGAHTIAVRARDTSNNLRTSSSTSVTVSNSTGTTTPGTNLVPNANFETAGTGGNPASWNRGGWGTNTRTFTYPATGSTGSGAALTVTGYTNGDAKWYFNPVNVTAGTAYTIGDRYNSNISSQVVAQLTGAGGALSYVALDTLPSTGSTWQTYSRSYTPPAGTTQLTLFHLIAGNGTLTIDDVQVAGPGTGTTTDGVAPTVSLTAPAASSTVSGSVTLSATAADNVGVAGVTFLIDGVAVGSEDTTAPYSMSWNSASVSNGAHNVRARARDAAGNQTTSAIINVTVSNSTGTTTPVNLISNGNFETPGTGGNPAGWAPAGWGTHTADYNYPVPGFTGNAVEIIVTDYNLDDTGDARWGSATIPLTQGTRYTYETRYKATTITDVLCRYGFSDGSEHFFGLIKEIPPTPTWTRIENSFVPPVGAVDITCGHAISAETHSLAIDNVMLYANGTGTPSEINVPTVDFVSPVQGATLSGVVTLTATSSDDTAVVGVFFAVNGSPIGVEDLTAPYQEVWDTRTYPNGTYLLKATTRDPYGNNDNKTITVTVNNSATSTDTTLPTTSVTAPATGSTVSGSVNVTASASDNVAVAGVTLLIDGNAVGAEDTTAPYSFTWNSATVGNGAHTISVRARDTSNNLRTSTGISVTVNNSTSTGNNLVNNGTFEMAGAGSDPAAWNRGGWGNNTRTLTYPVSGQSGSGAEVAITAYTDGDVKWYFNPVDVTAGTTYTVSDSYRSNAPTSVIVQWTRANGTLAYDLVESLPSSGGAWQTWSEPLVVPASTTKFTLFHLLSAVGTLTIDNMSVVQN